MLFFIKNRFLNVKFPHNLKGILLLYIIYTFTYKETFCTIR